MEGGISSLHQISHWVWYHTHIYIPPHSSSKWVCNGSAERKHRHIVETCLTLLAQVKMPLKFWDHAFLTATYLIKRLPSPTINNPVTIFFLCFNFLIISFSRALIVLAFLSWDLIAVKKLIFTQKSVPFWGTPLLIKATSVLTLQEKSLFQRMWCLMKSGFPYPELFSTSSNYTIAPDEPNLSSFLPTYLPTSTASSSSPTNSPTSPPIINSPISSAGQNSPSATPNQQSPILTPASHTDSVPPYSPAHVFNPTPITILSTSPSNTSSESLTPTPITPPPKPHRIHPLNTHSMATRGKLGIV